MRSLIPFPRRDRRGVSSLELALVSPVLIAAMIGLAEIAYTLTVDGLLNYAARAAARSGFTGVIQSGYTDRRAQVCDTVRRLTYGILDQTRLTVQSHSYATFSTLSQTNGGAPPATSLTSLNCNSNLWNASQTAAALGQSGQVVVYVLRYDQPLLTGLGAGLLGQDVLVHEARLAVRNEPFMTTE
jgi:Flp pilus assembly protein TadG